MKAGALVAGAGLMLLGGADLVGRRDDAAESRERTLELAASVAASRFDADVAGAAIALAVSPDAPDLDHLAAALDAPVCRLGALAGADPGALSCTAAPSGDRLDPARDGGRVTALAVRAAGAEDRTAAELVAVGAGPGSADTATGVLVAVARSADTLITRVDVARVVAEGAVVRTPGPATAPLQTGLTDGPWYVRVGPGSGGDEPGALGLDGGAVALIGLQLTVGAALLAGSIVALRRDARGLRRRATTDGLTGLPNRAEFERRAGQLLARAGRDGTGACLVLVDLDRFKQVNDSGGHTAGDRVLVEVATRLSAAVRPGDLVARWGGDEFVVLLIGVGDRALAPARAGAMARCLAGIATVGEHRLTASVGAAVSPLDGSDLAALLDVADRAMYAAKPVARTGSPAAAARMAP